LLLDDVERVRRRTRASGKIGDRDGVKREVVEFASGDGLGWERAWGGLEFKAKKPGDDRKTCRGDRDFARQFL
jgi:hypothetical protein